MNAGSSAPPPENTNNEGTPTKEPSSTPTNASDASTAVGPTTKETKPKHISEMQPTPTAFIDSDRAAMALDHADVVLPASALQKVRDVDGVQLIAKRRQEGSSHSTISGEAAQAVTVYDELPKGAESRQPSSESPKKMLLYEVDTLHYRKLVKGLVPLRSSLMKANYDASNTDFNKKSVHFSDQSGYNLSCVRSYDKAVRN